MARKRSQFINLGRRRPLTTVGELRSALAAAGRVFVWDDATDGYLLVSPAALALYYDLSPKPDAEPFQATEWGDSLFIGPEE